jgi:hypothetical protein
MAKKRSEVKTLNEQVRKLARWYSFARQHGRLVKLELGAELQLDEVLRSG